MIDWPREVIIPIVAALLGIIGGIGVAAKTIMPRFAEAFISDQQKKTDDALADKRARREQEAEDEANERQTTVALLSQVVQLSMASQAQSKELIQFITGSMRVDLKDYQAKIEQALKDIDQRWLAVNRELQAGSGKTQMLTGEISELGDRIMMVEHTLRTALNGNFKSKRVQHDSETKDA